MPAPFVVAHLQVGLTMQGLDAALSDDGGERAGVFLTNALTGWEPVPQKPLPFPELEEERDRAERVKRDTPVLVILGNPPYNGFAGMAVDEERELSQAYRAVKDVRKPEGQGLNDLYVRFFRMAERRIAEKTGRGVVCFISNYSWLDGLSFTGMRERYLDAFDAIRVDNLHGDRIISEYAPDGRTSETVFAIQGQSPGIRIGTAITLMSKSGSVADGNGNGRILYRDFQQARAEERRAALLDSLDAPAMDSGYTEFQAQLDIGLPFKPMAVNPQWSEWPSLPDLFPTSFPGVKTSRDSFLIDVDLDRLEKRVADYFNNDLSHEEIARLYPSVMNPAARYNPRAVRDSLLKRNEPDGKSGIIRYAYRPFDNRWLYWEADTKLLDEKRADYRPHVFDGNIWLSSGQHLRKGAEEPQTWFTTHMGSLHLIERGASMFPAWLRDEQGEGQQGMLDVEADGGPTCRGRRRRTLDRLGLGVEELFYHALAVLHDPAYRAANAGALRMEWPRIPLPGWPDGDAAGAAGELRGAALRGSGAGGAAGRGDGGGGGDGGGAAAGAGGHRGAFYGGRAEYEAGEDFAVTAGWGHFGTGEAVMPGQGRAVERGYTDGGAGGDGGCGGGAGGDYV